MRRIGESASPCQVGPSVAGWSQKTLKSSSNLLDTTLYTKPTCTCRMSQVAGRRLLGTCDLRHNIGCQSRNDMGVPKRREKGGVSGEGHRPPPGPSHRIWSNPNDIT